MDKQKLEDLVEFHCIYCFEGEKLADTTFTFTFEGIRALIADVDAARREEAESDR